MKLQGEYNFKDFMDLYFNKYYFNSKQNLANRAILTLGIGILVIEFFLFLFLNNVYTTVSTYLDAKLVIFLLVIFSASYFFKPKLIYENYKKNHKPGSYIEVTEDELKDILEQIQKVTDKSIAHIDLLMEDKEKELMSF